MPRPKKHVFICSQARPAGHPRGSCAARGCREVQEEFLRQYQQRQVFETIAVTLTACIGPCGTGPNVLVYPEGVLYNNVRVSDVTSIFDQHLLGDQPVEALKAPAEIW